jgi:hypothetical protein
MAIHRDDENVHFVLEQHAQLDLHSANSLKQLFAGIHVIPLGHIILIRVSHALLLHLSAT